MRANRAATSSRCLAAPSTFCTTASIVSSTACRSVSPKKTLPLNKKHTLKTGERFASYDDAVDRARPGDKVYAAEFDYEDIEIGGFGSVHMYICHRN